MSLRASVGPWRRRLRPVLLVGLALGLAAGARASAARLDGLDDGEVPSGGRIALVVVLLAAGQLSVGYGWRRLVPELRDPVESMWTFHATQPGKYLPLGIGQAVGQVALARDQGLPLRSALAAWASHIAVIVAAGVAVGVLVVGDVELGPVRWAALACPAALVVVHRGVLGRLVGIGARATRRLPRREDLPAQRGLVEAFGASVGYVVLHGLAFAVLLGGEGAAPLPVVVGAYALAVGLSTATPLPAGLGVREGLLVLLVGGDAGVVLAAAILLRVLAFGVESAILGCFWVVRRWRRGRRPESAH